jgi:hypothetical protein
MMLPAERRPVGELWQREKRGRFSVFKGLQKPLSAQIQRI